MPSLSYAERAADGKPDGLLALHHGRGADERDLLGLADALDPDRRLRVVSPRAPLHPPGESGFHWYLVPRVGHPDRDTFRSARDALASLHELLWEQTGVGPERTVVGGFSMGAVMSYAMGLSEDRPAVAGILALSGFVPTVDGWRPHLEGRSSTAAFVAHGRDDPVIDVGFGRRARDLLEDGGLPVEYHEPAAGHWVDRAVLPAARAWLDRAIPRDRPAPG